MMFRRAPGERPEPATPMAQQIIERGTLLEQAARIPTAVKALGAVFALGFLAVNAAIGYLVVDARLEGEWYDLRDLGWPSSGCAPRSPPLTPSWAVRTWGPCSPTGCLR